MNLEFTRLLGRERHELPQYKEAHQQSACARWHTGSPRSKPYCWRKCARRLPYKENLHAAGSQKMRKKLGWGWLPKRDLHFPTAASPMAQALLEGDLDTHPV